MNQETRPCECGQVMVVASFVDYEGLSDGQLADHMAGFWKNFECASCGATETFETTGGMIDS